MTGNFVAEGMRGTYIMKSKIATSALSFLVSLTAMANPSPNPLPCSTFIRDKEEDIAAKNYVFPENDIQFCLVEENSFLAHPENLTNQAELEFGWIQMPTAVMKIPEAYPTIQRPGHSARIVLVDRETFDHWNSGDEALWVLAWGFIAWSVVGVAGITFLGVELVPEITKTLRNFDINIASMAQDMSRMEKTMEKIAKYMETINRTMVAMADDVHAMTGNTAVIKEYMPQMIITMKEMNAEMRNYMGQLTKDVSSMNRAFQTMTGPMQIMRGWAKNMGMSMP